MALEVKVGKIDVSGTGNYSVTGMSNSPDLILFQTVLLTSDSDTYSTARYAFGACDGDLNQFYTAMRSDTGVSTTDTYRRSASAYCQNIMSGSGGVEARTKVASINSDGFTFNVDIYPDSSSREFHYMAISGCDVEVFTFLNDGTLGNHDVTGLSFKPEALILSTAWQNPIGQANNVTYLSHGFCDKDFNQYGHTVHSADNRSTSSTARLTSNEYLINLVDASTIYVQEKISAWKDDGFTYTSDVNYVSQHYIFGIALKGIKSKAGYFDTPITIGTETVSTGFEFESMLSLLGGTTPSVGFDTIQANNFIGAGFSNGVNDHSIVVYDQNNVGTSSTYRHQSQDKSVLLGTTSTILKGAVTAKTASNFSVAYDTVHTNPITVPYFLLAQAPVASTSTPTNIGKNQATLQGSIDNMGGESSLNISFEYGTTDSYGETIQAGTKTTTGSVSASIENLILDTTYHFRLKATNANGTWYSSDATFKTEILGLKISSGQLTINSTSAISVTGLDFEPDLILFQYISNTATSIGSAIYSFGASDGTNQFCTAIRSSNGATTTDTSRWCSESYIACGLGASQTILSRIALNSIDSGGFTVQSADYPDSTDRTLNWIAIGGLDDVKVFSFNANTSTGSRDITSLGFEPDALMLFGTRQTVLDTAQANVFLISGICDNSYNQLSQAVFSQDNLSTSNTQRYTSNSYIYSEIATADSGSIVGEEKVTTMLSNGFTVQADAASSSAHYLFGLAISGVNSKVGYTTEKATTGTKQVSGIGFEFDSLLTLLGGTEGGFASNCSFGVGWTHGVDSQSLCGVWDDSNVGTTVAYRHQTTDSVYAFPKTTLAVEAELSVKDSDSFTLDFTTVDGSERWIPYLAFAKVPIISTSTPTNIGKNQAVLNGSIDYTCDESSFVVSFEYGETDSYGEIVQAGTKTTTGAVSASITGLTADTTYHFRMKATSVNGTWYSSDATFSTKASDLKISSGQLTINSTAETSVTGLDFEPDFVLFQYIADSAGSTTHAINSFGASDGTNHFCTAVYSRNGVGTTDTSRWCSESYIAAKLSLGQILSHKIALNSINSNGFTVQSSDYPDSTDRTLNWFAIGGLEDVAIVTHNTRTSTGTTDITTIGFEPDAAILASSISINLDTVDTALVTVLGFCDSDLNQHAIATYGKDSQAAGNEERWLISDHIYSWGNNSAIQAQEKISAWLSNGLTMQCTDADTWSRNSFIIALKGVNSKVGYTTEKATTGTTQVSSIGFELEALFTILGGGTSFDSTINDTTAGMGWAHSTNSADQLYTTYYAEDGADPTNVYRYQNTGSCYVSVGSSVLVKADLSAKDSNSFTLNFTTVEGSARIIPYLAIGNDYTPIEGPQITTNAATNVDTTTVTLNGEVTDMGGEPYLDVYFEYGTLTAYGMETMKQRISAPGTFTANVSGLTDNQLYHFRAVAMEVV